MATATTFAFRAMDLAGVSSSGEIQADSKAQVSEQLRQRGLIVLDVSEKSSPFNIEDVFKRWQGVKTRELAIFARQFATLVSSGMPMLRTLQTLSEQSEDELLKEAIADLHDDVEAGSSLEQAMERHPKVFDRLMRSMVRSGEQSGRLDDALDRIAFHLEKMDTLRRQVRSALMYPAFVFVFAILVLLAVVMFIIPVFVGVFNQLAEETPGVSAELPLPDPDLRRRLRRPHRLLVHPLPGAGRRSRSPCCAGRRPTAAAPSGTAPSCGSRSRSATWCRRSPWPAGRAPSPARSPPACRCCRRSS